MNLRNKTLSRKVLPQTLLKKLPALIVVITSSVVIASCGSAAKRTGQGGNGDSGATTSSVDLTGGVQGTRVDPDSVAGRAPKQRVIYFDFNTSEISPEYLAVITEHGRFLGRNPDGRVRLEGHTDERGSREYNVALGENRARAISRMMLLQGVATEQMQSVSFGEELPVEDGHTEAAWSANRRVNIIYEVE